jgi:hypothetical protein
MQTNYKKKLFLCTFKIWDDLREKESLVSLTHNVLLANLCCANLLSAVLVKANCLA